MDDRTARECEDDMLFALCIEVGTHSNHRPSLICDAVTGDVAAAIELRRAIGLQNTRTLLTRLQSGI